MGGQVSTSEFVTDLETLELTTGKLDSMLFEIPPGYTQVQDCAELQDKMDMNEMIKGMTDKYKNEAQNNKPVSEQKAAGMMRIR